MYMSTFKSLGAEWHVDSGHAWLAVDLRMHPRALECGTGFGYIDTSSEVIYLEEDIEAMAFCRTNAAVCLYSMAGRLDSVDYAKDATCRSLPRNENLLVVPPYTA